ncbi:MAG: helix-turn-helix transcriptional regulator [Desulfarculus sp.]|nr:helix-turn-helix transcriptional regulator [Desulfarculus sp.]
MPQRATLMEEQGCSVRVVHLERLVQARAGALSPRQLERLSALYRAMGDPGRLGILLALAQGEMCVCDLAALLKVSESAVSHQLRRLRDLFLVKTRRDAQCLYYSLDDLHVNQLLAVGLAHVEE